MIIDSASNSTAALGLQVLTSLRIFDYRQASSFSSVLPAYGAGNKGAFLAYHFNVLWHFDLDVFLRQQEA
jgi:hypothetical protein